MSHVTQCPKCRTHFKVVADQLKISDGWVRCGSCAEVFDARRSVQPWPADEAPEGARAQPAAGEPKEAPSHGESLALPVPQAGTLSPNHTSETQLEPQLAVEPGAQPLVADTPETEPPVAEPSPREPDVAFVRQAKRRAFWQKPWVRALSWVTGLALLLLLVAQVVVDQRDRWVAMYPELAPWGQAICEPLGCRVEPFRQIDAVLIDSSALVDERDGVYRLEVAFKNTSALVLAVPALEFSLTNTADEVLLRRVLLPTDWDTPPATLAPHATVALAVRLSLSGANGLRMSGYRALAFYP